MKSPIGAITDPRLNIPKGTQTYQNECYAGGDLCEIGRICGSIKVFHLEPDALFCRHDRYSEDVNSRT